MIKNNKGKMVLTSIVILLPIFIGLILWNRLPDRMPTHWNAEGLVDGWSSKAMAVFGLPVFVFVIHWICVLVSSVDPKYQNYTGKMLEIIFWICPALSVVAGAMTYATALGMDIQVETIMPVVFGLMFTIIGNYLPKCKQNYTIGIKVPWTLDDEENWNKTHRLAGKMWVVGGVIILIAAFLPTKIMAVLFFVIIVVMAIVPTIYSYIFYKKKNNSF